MIALLVSGCWTVHPPAALPVSDTVPIFISDYGVHSAVLLPISRDVYVEYSFGDWAYAVNNYEAPWNAIAALTISLQGALGRTFSVYDASLSPWPMTLRQPLHIVKINADRTRVAKVVAELDARYAAGEGPPVFNYENQGFFVRDDTHYSIFNSCNTLTAHILKEVGCDVNGWALLADFKFDPTPAKQR